MAFLWPPRPGLRLGAVLGQRKSLALVRRSLPPYPVNTAALVAAVAAVKERKTIALYVAEVKRLRGWLSTELTKRGAKVFPSSGNFILAEFGPNGSPLFQELARQNVLVRERRDVGPGFARITIGTESELKKLLRILPKSFRKSNA